MIWSPQQDAALIAVERWRRERESQVFALFGYAGTGKTTLARHLAENVVGLVKFAAFTGKAAHVMRANGCSDACTIHHLIYRFEGKGADGKLVFSLDRDSAARRAKLIVIDECSMVDAAMGRDLLRFGVPVLTLGDPAQLPAINGAGFFTAREPDAMLTEIHRQARDNPIVAMASAIREGRRLDLGAYGASAVTDRFDANEMAAADQILVGRNRTREVNNDTQRRLRSREGPYPREGDKLVCLRNDYRRGLLNGSLWLVADVQPVVGEVFAMKLAPDDGTGAVWVDTHAKLWDGRGAELAERDHYAQFDFGHALTVHKAQGSQWGSVAVVDESRCFGADRRRWLYTAVTRATDKVTVITRDPWI